MNTSVELIPQSAFQTFFPVENWWRALYWIFFVEAINIVAAYIFNHKFAYDHALFFVIGWVCASAGFRLLLPARLTISGASRPPMLAAVEDILENPKYRLKYRRSVSGVEWYCRSAPLVYSWNPTIHVQEFHNSIILTGPHVTLESISKLLTR